VKPSSKPHAASLARLNICTWKTCKAKPMWWHPR
jgi:hypothetical protein